MFLRLYRLRRRFLFLAFGLFIWMLLVIGFGGQPFGTKTADMSLGDPVTWAAVALTALIVGVIAWVLIGVLAIEFRGVVELTALVGLANWMLGLVVPLADEVVWLTFFAFLVIFVRLLYGPILDKATLKRPKRMSRSFSVKHHPGEVWKVVAPLPEHSEHFYPPRTAIGREEDGSILTIYPMRDGQMYQAIRLSGLEAEAPSKFETRFAPAVPTQGTAGLSGGSRFLVEPEGDGSRVTIEEARDPAPLRRRLQWYLDDEFQDRCDSLVAHFEGRRDFSVYGLQLPK